MAKAKEKQRYKRGENPNSRANLKPIEKGRSGNPAGMKPGTKHRSTLLREVVDIIANFQNPITKATEKMPVEMRMEYAIVGKAMKGDVQAYREVKDSLYGKIPNKEEISIDPKVADLRAKIQARASEKGVTYEQELALWNEKYSDNVAPEIKTRLISELAQ